MGNYDRYSRFIVRSVDHIFKNFLNDSNIAEVFEPQSKSNMHLVTIEIQGTLSGELIFNLPLRTLDLITKKMIPGANSRSMKKHYNDVAGELANLISGTFVNQLQFLNHQVRLSPPEVDDEPAGLRTFFENINLSFVSSYGGFDIDLYYKENR
jgi:CheY-specific phosphatase CheX